MWHVVIALISIDEQYDHSSCIEYLIIPHLIPPTPVTFVITIFTIVIEH